MDGANGFVNSGVNGGVNRGVNRGVDGGVELRRELRRECKCDAGWVGKFCNEPQRCDPTVQCWDYQLSNGAILVKCRCDYTGRRPRHSSPSVSLPRVAPVTFVPRPNVLY